MAYVIAQPCEGVCDRACVHVCPMDCIHGPVAQQEIDDTPQDARAELFKGIQLFINPVECIDCGVCVAECPVDAIFHEDELPAEWKHYQEKNSAFFEHLQAV